MFDNIYMAPIMGNTDSIYRKIFSEHFNSINKAIIPFINKFRIPGDNRIKSNFDLDRQSGIYTIPQILTNDSRFLSDMASAYSRAGYNEINLNIACPSPVMTKKNMGAALIEFPDILDKLLTAYFRNPPLPLSVKLRTGMKSAGNFKTVMDILCSYDITSVTLHPRTAEQGYSGSIDMNSFEYALQKTPSSLVYSGDINSHEDAGVLKERYPELNNIMLGRGLLQRPQLAEEIKKECTIPVSIDRIILFHNSLLEMYEKHLYGEKQILDRMKAHWVYFSKDICNGKKILKSIKKSGSLKKYRNCVSEIEKYKLQK